MSAYAVTPEIYAAWQYLETDEEDLYEREQAEMLREEEELGLLLADLEGSPTVAKLEQYLKQLFELQCFTQRSLARKLERYHCEDVCLADLEARPEAYPCFGTEEEIRQHVEGLQRKDGELASLVAQVEEGQRSYAENVHRLNVVNGLIAKRRRLEEEFEGEQEDYESNQDDNESEQDEDDSEQDDSESDREEHEGEQSIRMKLDYLRIH
ncbi:hypothetical protein DFH94DRAFT_848780 [Russula ochroleuca]|uniref:Uncharacterized protein n=1 Tax=Russula ochroleuca TaxID=152965 RepID=A0A9P5JW13_9AGAM|nr:hypothetical protein DFH94DRAFT_848780 [Russula ochroleuca]